MAKISAYPNGNPIRATDLFVIARAGSNFSVSMAQGEYPDGMLLNGRISASVAGNNLTVAIKDKTGSDPSAASPVFVWIGGTCRTITAALSITLAAGTNWFGYGGAAHATLNRYYFVYLGYNTTDGVTLGFSPIPWARAYSDFNTTSTNERYGAISNISHAAAADAYVNIGQFSAILSAAAGYTWSGPGNVVNAPVFSTPLMTYVPTLTNVTNTNGTLYARYSRNNRIIRGFMNFELGASSAVSGGISISFPVSIASYSPPASSRATIGGAAILDAGATVFMAELLASGEIRVRNVAGTYEALTVTSNLIPMTWATGDSFGAFFDYEE